VTRVGSFLVAAIMAVTSTAAAVFAAELAVRYVDGYALRSVKLKARQTVAVSPPSDSSLRAAASRHAAATRSTPELDLAWFEEEPPPLPNRRPPNHYFRDIMAGGDHFDLFKLWNAQFVRAHPEHFERFPGFAFLYIPDDGSLHPPYRFFPNSTNPAGLVTNQFGFRGPPVDLEKPSDVIRIAFLGSSATSTVHNYPFSYPELVEFWLNRWAMAAKLGVRFEAINAGREGIGSEDIAKIFVDEVIPLRPDLLVYYEGGNQFDLNAITSRAAPFRLAEKIKPGYVDRAYAWLGASSAIWRRIAGKVPGGALREGTRLPYTLNWPVDVDERTPDLDSPDLPLHLPVILKDLDIIRTAAHAAGGELILSSFKWLVSDKLVLDPARHSVFHDALEKYPWHYSDMRRMADFQNRVFERYAKHNGVDFLDVDRLMPSDPDLFFDPVHKTYPGEKTHAWVVVNHLIPLLRKRLASDSLPKKPAPSEHPMWGDKVARMTLASVPAKEICREGNPGRAVALKDVTAVYRLTEVELGDVLTIRTGSERWIYAVEAAIPIPPSQSAERISVSIDYEVLSGQVGFGLLAPDRSRFLTQQASETGSNRKLSLTPPTLERTGKRNLWLNVYNASESGPSVVQIRSITICYESMQTVYQAVDPIAGGTFGSLASELAGHEN
jgi:hypothetical protein